MIERVIRYSGVHNQARSSVGLELVGSASSSSQLFALLRALAVLSMLAMFWEATTSWIMLIICLRTNIGVEKNRRSHHAPNPNIGKTKNNVQYLKQQIIGEQRLPGPLWKYSKYSEQKNSSFPAHMMNSTGYMQNKTIMQTSVWFSIHWLTLS